MQQTTKDFINDADYAITSGPVGKRILCLYYRTWANMKYRCTSSKFKKENPTYEGVYCCTSWLKFMNFREWMLCQNWEGMQLDKDLLVSGNKVYSPETCRFVPLKVNCLLGTKTGRGIYPWGVIRKGKDKSMINERKNPYFSFVYNAEGYKQPLGSHKTEEAAHKAWQIAKAKVILDVVNWWALDASVSQSYDEGIADSLLKKAAKLIIDSNNNIETTSLI